MVRERRWLTAPAVAGKRARWVELNEKRWTDSLSVCSAEQRRDRDLKSKTAQRAAVAGDALIARSKERAFFRTPYGRILEFKSLSHRIAAKQSMRPPPAV